MGDRTGAICPTTIYAKRLAQNTKLDSVIYYHRFHPWGLHLRTGSAGRAIISVALCRRNFFLGLCRERSSTLQFSSSLVLLTVPVGDGQPAIPRKRPDTDSRGERRRSSNPRLSSTPSEKCPRFRKNSTLLVNGYAAHGGFYESRAATQCCEGPDRKGRGRQSSEFAVDPQVVFTRLGVRGVPCKS